MAKSPQDPALDQQPRDRKLTGLMTVQSCLEVWENKRSTKSDPAGVTPAGRDDDIANTPAIVCFQVAEPAKRRLNKFIRVTTADTLLTCRMESPDTMGLRWVLI